MIVLDVLIRAEAARNTKNKSVRDSGAFKFCFVGRENSRTKKEFWRYSKKCGKHSQTKSFVGCKIQMASHGKVL